MYGSMCARFLRLSGSKDMLLIHEGRKNEEEQIGMCEPVMDN